MFSPLSSKDRSLAKRASHILDVYYPQDEAAIMQNEVDLAVANEASPVLRFVVNFHTRGYVFVSENISEVLGSSPGELIEKGLARSLDLFWSEHREVFSTEMLPLMMEWFADLAKKGKDVLKARLVYHLCMNHVNGKAVSTMHVMKPITIDAQGLPLLAVKYICDISHHESLIQPSMALEYKVASNRYEVLKTKLFYPKYMGSNLSKRESEVLALVKAGNSSKEIATMLNLSLHTVNNHRKNIVQKCKVKSVYQVPAASTLQQVS